MGLLTADLRMLGNLATTPDGRRVAIGTGIGFVLFGLMSWWVAQALGERPELIALVHQQTGGESLRGLIGYGLMACPMVAMWYGLSLAQRQLFETPELMLWRTAPLAAFRGPVQVLLRACFVSCCWSLALAGPFLVAFLARSPAPAMTYALIPVAVLCCTAPLLATLLALQIVLVRFFAGRVLRIVLAITVTVASIGFFAWFLLTLFTPSQARVHDVINTAATPGALPWTVDTAAAMLVSSANGALDLHATYGVLLWLLLAVSIFTVAALLHPRACERQLETEAPLATRWRRRWPARAAAAVRKKEFAQLIQQPGALLSFLLFPLLVWGLAQKRLLIGGMLQNPRLPDEVANLGAMLALWFVAVMLVLYAHMGRLAMWDGAQWPLYMASPTRPATILRGKLTAIAMFLLWPLVVVAVAGVHLLGADRTTLLTFTGVAVAGSFVALGVLATIGTWPRLMRPDEGGQVLQGARSFVAAILLVLAFDVATLPGWGGWIWLDYYAHQVRLDSRTAVAFAPRLVATALAFGGLIGSLGIHIGARNYRRLLTPR